MGVHGRLHLCDLSLFGRFGDGQLAPDRGQRPRHDSLAGAGFRSALPRSRALWARANDGGKAA